MPKAPTKSGRPRGPLFWAIVAALVIAAPFVGYYVMAGIGRYLQMRGA